MSTASPPAAAPQQAGRVSINALTSAQLDALYDELDRLREQQRQAHTGRPSVEDVLVAVEAPLERHLLPDLGLLEKVREDVVAALVDLLAVPGEGGHRWEPSGGLWCVNAGCGIDCSEWEHRGRPACVAAQPRSADGGGR